MLYPHPSDRAPFFLTSGSASAPSSAPAPAPAPAPPGGRETGGGGTPGAGAALEGRRIGLICQSRHSAAAALFIEAAEGLGAQVSVLHATDVVDAGDGQQGQQDKLVRMLSRLYDVIECQDLPPVAVRRISELVAVPVLANLGGSALRGAEVPAPVRSDTQAWEQGLARVRQALLRAL